MAIRKQLPLFPLGATVDLGPIPGNSQSRRILAKDGNEYIAKGLHSRDANPHVLINEFICTQMAHILKLPVPPMEVLQFQGNLWFGSQFLDDADFFGEHLFEADISNRKATTALIVFDIFVRNVDRHKHNVLAQRYLAADRKNYKYHLWGIDFGHCILHNREKPIERLSQTFDHLRFNRESILIQAGIASDHQWIENAIQNIVNLKINTIHEIVTSVPPPWWPHGVSKDNREEICKCLTRWKDELPKVARGILLL